MTTASSSSADVDLRLRDLVAEADGCAAVGRQRGADRATCCEALESRPSCDLTARGFIPSSTMRASRALRSTPAEAVDVAPYSSLRDRDVEWNDGARTREPRATNGLRDVRLAPREPARARSCASRRRRGQRSGVHLLDGLACLVRHETADADAADVTPYAIGAVRSGRLDRRLGRGRPVGVARSWAAPWTAPVPAPAVADNPKAAAKPRRAQTARSPAANVRVDAFTPEV